MNYKTSGWLIGLGVAALVLPGFNLLGVGALALGVGNAVGKAGNDNGYKALR